MAVRFGSNNRLGQRLMAAGASPERAQQFVEQSAFAQGPQLPAFAGAKAPKALGDPFDDQSRAASESWPEFKDVFRPPSPSAGGTLFKDYVDVVIGRGAYDSLTAKYTKGLAPTYNKALTAPQGTFEYVIANGIKDGLTPETVYESALALPIIGTRTDAQINSYVYKLFDEYTKLQNFDVNKKLVEELNKNKAYKFGLPDQKLRYGLTTDLKKGTISIMTHPAVAAVYRQVSPTLKGNPAAQTYFNSWITGVLADANAQRRTPYLDEVKRREKFRGKKVGG